MFTRSIQGTTRCQIDYIVVHNIWKCIIVSYFFENESVTEKTYKRMILCFLFRKLRAYPNDAIFEQNVPLPHFALIARQNLDQKFGSPWIGQGGPVTWPPRSLMLTPSEFFLYGYIKNGVFYNFLTTIIQPRIGSPAAYASNAEESLQKVMKIGNSVSAYSSVKMELILKLF